MRGERGGHISWRTRANGSNVFGLRRKRRRRSRHELGESWKHLYVMVSRMMQRSLLLSESCCPCCCFIRLPYQIPLSRTRAIRSPSPCTRVLFPPNHSLIPYLLKVSSRCLFVADKFSFLSFLVRVHLSLLYSLFSLIGLLPVVLRKAKVSSFCFLHS